MNIRIRQFWSTYTTGSNTRKPIVHPKLTQNRKDRHNPLTSENACRSNLSYAILSKIRSFASSSYRSYRICLWRIRWFLWNQMADKVLKHNFFHELRSSTHNMPSREWFYRLISLQMRIFEINLIGKSEISHMEEL